MELCVSDLTIEYTSDGSVVRPVSDFNLRATSRSVVVLLGPNGCGKTSLLSCLAGILTPKLGHVRFGDVDVATLKGKALNSYRRRTVGIVFQAFNLVPSLTAFENVMVPLRNGGMKRRQARTRANELLWQVGLGEWLHARPGGLSGGQQQRVAIARALGFDPPIFLADEPTAHLDYRHVDSVMRLLRELANDDHLVVIATHDQRILQVADAVIELAPTSAHQSRRPDRVAVAAGNMRRCGASG
jgi:putative ABC transport system ATP-binding protein